MNSSRFFRNKRSIFGIVDMWNLISELILVSILIFSSFSYIQSIKTGTLYEKNYLSRDIAHLIDTIYSAPGNVLFVYRKPDLDISELKIQVSGNFVEVSEKEDSSKAISFIFPSDNNLGPVKASIDYLPFLVSKSGNNLKFSEQNLNILPFKKELLESTKIFVDAAGDPKENNLIGEIKESKITSIIAASFDQNKARLYQVQYSRIYSQPGDLINDGERISETEMEYLIRESDTLISINIGQDRKNIFYIKAFYPLSDTKESEKSRYLANKIINSIIDELPDSIDAASVVPVNLDIAENNPILQNDKVSVHLEIGTSQGPYPRRILNDKDKLKQIGKAIAGAFI